ncbi:GAF domain-containing sensor histidine kinase [Halapricum desulfuricans]|uniref:histidine kinase n=1 Tax=Halapricum desulfuricans TaxID=2841257 RepID=A0A897NTN5_9EURY|nr:GAF domain-containing sensor histidine kinase [Halapricum desulfuricans]QSG16178.1 Signal transduction histidine kinase [Halapricum desulfuricans]
MTDAEVRDYFQDLYRLGSDTSASLEEKIEQAITIGRDRLDVDYGVLSHTGSGDYEVIGSTIQSGQYAAGSTHDLETTWCRHVVSDDETLVISDAGDSPYSDDIARDVTGLQCYVGASIVVDGDTYGTLCFSGDEPRPSAFGAEEKQFVELLTQWIGHEIERERHYRALDAQNERLNEFAGVLAHDLRNPLTGARGYTELAAESVSGPESDYLQTALDSLDRMETLITETLTLAKEGADVGEREPVQLSSVARVAWETVSPTTATLEISNDRTVQADRSRLRQLFENLFRNVEEHCDAGVVVTVEGTQDGFAVEDTGPGLPEEIAESLFGGAYGKGRRGLGLLIVERVASGHGWNGSVESDKTRTRFEFSGVGVVTDPPRPAD